MSNPEAVKIKKLDGKKKKEKGRMGERARPPKLEFLKSAQCYSLRYFSS